MSIPFTAKGASGEVTFTGTVVQIRRVGALGFLRQLTGAGRGDKDIPLAAITGIRVERGSFSYKPFFQVIHSGADEVQGGGSDVANDDNAVFFSKSALADFERLRDLILEAKAGANTVASLPPLAAGGDDPAAALKKLSSLKEQGLITDEEFSRKREDILQRL